MLLAFAVALGCAVSWWMGGQLVAPAQRVVGEPPPWSRAESVELASVSGATLRGWWIPAGAPVEVVPGRATVVLLHPLHGDRRAMLGRAAFLSRAGYDTLLLDLQGHGESQGDAITAGWRERFDAAAAIAYAKARTPAAPLALIGWSLGGAATLLAHGEGDPPASLPPGTLDAIVLESVYPTLDEAIENRIALRLGPLAKLLTPLLTLQLPLRLDASADDLRPIDHIAELGCPVLVLSGTLDAHTPEAETRRLYDAAAEPKQLHLVDGAEHIDLHAFAPAEYEAVVLEFLESALAR